MKRSSFDSATDTGELRAAFEAAMWEQRKKSLPSQTLVIYCEQHLGVKMVRAVSWGLGQYGEASANVSWLDFWRCPKSDCDRCYDPMLFGYFRYKDQMGSRIERNPLEQKRCGIHVETPFLYIGKVDQGRQFLCPLDNCDNRGDWVSAVVVDEELVVSDDPVGGLGKAEREMSVFSSFARASGLAIDEGSAVNAVPQHPDIRCTIQGQLYWFELGEIVSEEVAKRTNSRGRIIGRDFSFSQEDPFVNIVNKKATKAYEKSCPIQDEPGEQADSNTR